MLSRRHENSLDGIAGGRLIHVDYRGMARLALQAVARRPAESFGLMVIAAAAVTILVNTLYLQPRPHPAPLFALKPAVPKAAPAKPAQPRARPAEAEAAKPDAPKAEATKVDAAPAPRAMAQIVADLQRELARRGFYDGPADGAYGAKTDMAIRDFAEAAGIRIKDGPSEALLRTITQFHTRVVPPPQNPRSAQRSDPIAALLKPSKRVVAIQRALRDFGYGQLTPSGVLDPETADAIRRFEGERKLPLSGQISERLVRDLSAATGRPLE